MSNDDGVIIDLMNNISLKREDRVIEVDIGVGPKGETPIKGVDYWTQSDRLAMFRDIRKALSYDAHYDLSQEVLSDEISGEELVYDSEKRAWKVFGEVRIAVPERSDYYLSIALAQRFDEGNITVGGDVVPIIDNMTFLLRDVEEVVFSVDIDVWIKAIAVQGFRPIILPTKVSELENDLGFVEGPVVVPTKVSELENDLGFVEGPVVVPTKVSELENDLGFVEGPVIVPTKVSELVNDLGFVVGPIIMPTKVSDLENDLGFVEGPIEGLTASVENETLILKVQ